LPLTEKDAGDAMGTPASRAAAHESAVTIVILTEPGVGYLLASA
jgi:hypothetical protein